MRGAVSAVAALLATTSLCAQVTPDGWMADLRFLAAEFPAKHKNAFAVVSREDFAARVAALEKRLRSLDEIESEAELVSLVAALGDSHSRVEMRALTAGERLPLGLYWFKDGLRLVAVPRQHEQVAGTLLRRIGSCDVGELARRVARLQHFDNEAMRRSSLPNLVVFPNVLEFLGVVEDGAKVPVTVVDDAGKEKVVTVRPGPIGRDAVVLRPRKLPVTARRAKWHDHEFLENEGILYVQYNKCSSNAENDLSRFTETLLGICARGGVRAIVFDVQYNGGGSSPLGDEMFAKLAAEPPLRSGKNVFCVIGRATFSSAILNAMTLKQRYRAVLVGEPTGGSPNHFGEVTHFDLPNSKLRVFYSQKLFQRAPPGTKTIEPDHLAESTFADYLEGRDVVLDAVRKLVR